MKYLVLCKVRISALASVSAAVGYILSPMEGACTLAGISLWVFILACGSSALNQWQERRTDALMQRTQRRPIASGEMSPLHGAVVATSLIVLGILGLGVFCSGGTLLAGIGVLAVIWYNGIYTYLKRTTALAAIPGAVVGMIPPALGCVAGGGSVLNPKFATLAVLLFLWQIPHFWLLVISFQDDYRRAGFPILTDYMSIGRVSRLIAVLMIGVVALGLTLLLRSVSPLWYGQALFAIGAAASIWVLYRAWRLTASSGPDTTAESRKAFIAINGFLLLLLVTVAASVVFSNIGGR
jgi:heme o synthase